MNCIIVEDEHYAAEHLMHQIKSTGLDVDVIATIDTVEHAVSWLKTNRSDLIFLDIELADGLSFEIFDHVYVNTPVIFTTSFEQYSMKAFDINSVAYLLKPVNADKLRMAIDKYRNIYEDHGFINEKISRLNQEYQRRFLVQTGNAVKSIPVEEVSYIQVQKKYLVVTVHSGQQYLFDGTLDLLENRLDPLSFFRVNRQFIVSINAIDTISHHSRGRLRMDTLPRCKEDIIVSAERTRELKAWLGR